MVWFAPLPGRADAGREREKSSPQINEIESLSRKGGIAGEHVNPAAAGVPVAVR